VLRGEFLDPEHTKRPGTTLTAIRGMWHILLQCGYQAGIPQIREMVGPPTVKWMSGRRMRKRTLQVGCRIKADISFFRISQGLPDANVRVRYLPGDQNGAVANDLDSGWARLCNWPPPVLLIRSQQPWRVDDYGWGVVTSYRETRYTQVNCMTMQYRVS
jgi:hypothetical protein